ncbi:hypothetical protein V8B55DRAFT_1447522 [Mucor lusitanicus]|uniref:Uncharacterized protein n=2 Tax=Mucor circinelloides f. lusitanicus TaxID=29924 RepID=A0A162R677_MUCCL|nr:hypothetical protein FB192DRAFT_1434793 [Mucor lusitanicus]OAD08710.1 hypothetical protein MUCCIDRAFT_105679 [Mucor lusitanicus CBS 277.49]
MSSTNHSSDLLNVNGKKKTLDDLVNASHNASNSNKSINDISAMMIDSESKRTFPVGQSDILSRVQAFLPQLKNANEQLEKADPSKLDIENVDEEDGQYIEMNLGLGVYEEKKPGQSDSEDDEDVDSDEEKLIIPNSAPVDKSKKPSIEVLDE